MGKITDCFTKTGAGLEAGYDFVAGVFEDTSGIISDTADKVYNLFSEDKAFKQKCAANRETLIRMAKALHQMEIRPEELPAAIKEVKSTDIKAEVTSVQDA